MIAGRRFPDILGSNVPEEEIKRQIGNSYDLIKPKARAKK
jgi:predicted DNA-binding protein (MmcQ/YjbR family)